MFATITDLEDRLGRTVPDIGQAEALLRYASQLVRGYARRHGIDLGTAEEPRDGVVEVVVEMVYRAISNPQGVTQDTAGPFSVSFGSDAAQRIYLSKSDKVILGGGVGAFTVNPADTDEAWLGPTPVGW